MARRKTANADHATHVHVLGNGAILEFRPSKLTRGWASRYLHKNGGADNWIYFGPDLPKDAQKL